MTLDPNARQVKQRVSVAPSPATSGTDFMIDHATTYFFNSFEQTVPFKITVYPMNETPTKQNSEVILVRSYSTSTRTGTTTVAEVQAGGSSPGQVSVTETTPGDSTIPQSEVQTVTLTATSGTYTLSFGGSTTAALAYNATAATVQAALQGLTSIGAGNATVSGSAGGPYTVTFAGTLANSPQALLTSDPTNLVYGGAGTVAVAETTHGGVGVDEVQTVTVTGTGGSFTLSFGGQTTANLSWNISPASLQTELQALSSIGSGNCAVSGAPGAYTVEFTGTLGGAAQALMTADATLLSNGGRNEIQTVAVDADGGTFRLSADGGVNYTAALAYNASAATVQTAVTGLAAVGANNAVVTYNSTAGVYTVTFVGGKAATSMSLTADASSLTVSTAHITSCTRAQDNTTARTIVVGDHLEVTKLLDATVTAFIPDGTTNDLDISSVSGEPECILSYSAARSGATVTGIAGGTPGRTLRVVNYNTGTSTVTLANQNTGSLIDNRINVISGTDLILQPGEAADLVYLPSIGINHYRWYVLGVTQTYRAIATPTYGATVTPSAAQGAWQTITVTNTSAFTIAAPTNTPDSGHTQELTIEVYNNSGGTLGTITWNAAFVFAGLTFTKPANGKKRFARFEWNGANWICTSTASSDY